MIREEILEERLNGIDNLPTLPLVLQQIQKVMENPRSSLAQVATVVAKDQALASRAIRLVNSAYYARSSRITSIQQAIVTLGLKTLNNLMLGLSVIKMFTNSKSFGYDPQDFWKHSFGTAIIAKKIARTIHAPVDGDECFIAGLLHDMGRLVMEQFFHDDFIAALKSSHEKNGALLLQELEIFGFTHADVGAWLGKKWNIPHSLTVAMEFHHTPDIPTEVTPQERALLDIIAFANILCNRGGIGSSGEHKLMIKTPVQFLKLDDVARNQLIDETRKEVNETITEWTHN